MAQTRIWGKLKLEDTTEEETVRRSLRISQRLSGTSESGGSRSLESTKSPDFYPPSFPMQPCRLSKRIAMWKKMKSKAPKTKSKKGHPQV